MVVRYRRRNQLSISLVLALASLMVLFQNCGGSFQSAPPPLTSGSAGGTGPIDDPPGDQPPPNEDYFPPADKSPNEELGSWESISWEEAGFDSTESPRIFDFLLRPMVNSRFPEECGTNTSSLMIIYKGKIVTEWYNPNFGGANWARCKLFAIDQTIPHDAPWTNLTSGDMYSATKSVISTLIGIFLEKNLIKSIDDPVSDYLGDDWTCIAKEPGANILKFRYTAEEARSLERAVTIRSLMNMTSGIGGTGIGDGGVYPYYVTEPGKVWFYNTNLYHQLINLLAAANGDTPPRPDCSLAPKDYVETVADLTALSKKYLFNAIGMTHTYFRNNSTDPRENYKTAYSTTRDMARFGLLVLRGGRWRNSAGQIVSILNYESDGYGSALKSYALGPNQTADPVFENKSYGYLWWLNGKDGARLSGTDFQACYIYKNFGIDIGAPLRPSGELPDDLSACDANIPTLISAAPGDLFAALGGLDKKIYIVPSLDLVVVRQGGPADEFTLASTDFDSALWQVIMAARKK